MYFVNRSFSLVALALLALAVPAFAAPKHYKTTVSGRLGQFVSQLNDKKSAKKNSNKSLALSIPATVNVVVPTYGPVKISFFSLQSKDWDASFEGSNGVVEDNKSQTLFKGVALFQSSNEEVPVAGSVYKVNGVPRAFIHFSAPETNSPNASIGGASGKRDLFELRFSVTGDGQVSAKAELWAASKDDFQGSTCAASSENSEQAPLALRKLAFNTLPTSLKVLDLATEGDKEWFDQYGVSSNAQMATVVNAADTIYQRDLNIDLNIVHQSTQTSISQPYTATDANTLLDQFRTLNSGLGSADAYHLFTGKNLDGSTVGIAWVGVICAFPSYSYGLTQKLSPTLDHVIFAHEIGHNFGGDHDSSLPATVMYPSVGSTQTTFSSTSITQINNHIASSPVCLATATATPTPTPTATATATPTATPTSTATPTPTATATPAPTGTPEPTSAPTAAPTNAPSPVPTEQPTAAPTPTPTATATPEPRSGPDPSDPDDGLPSPETTSLNLQARYSASLGRTDLTVTLGGESNKLCRLNVQIADNLAFTKARVISLRQARNTRISISSRTSVRNRSEKVYLRATYNGCGGQAVLSETAEINPFTARMRIKESPAKWISRL